MRLTSLRNLQMLATQPASSRKSRLWAKLVRRATVAIGPDLIKGSGLPNREPGRITAEQAHRLAWPLLHSRRRQSAIVRFHQRENFREGVAMKDRWAATLPERGKRRACR